MERSDDLGRGDSGELPHSWQAELRDSLDSVIYWETDPAGSVTHLAGSVREILGVEPEDAIGRSLDALLAYDGYRIIEQFVCKATEMGDGSETPRAARLNFLRADGFAIETLSAVSIQTKDDGTCASIRGASRIDMGPPTMAWPPLQACTWPAAIVSRDTFTIELCNGAFSRLLDSTPTRLRGAAFPSLFEAQGRLRLISHLREVSRDSGCAIDGTLLGPGEAEIPVRIDGTALEEAGMFRRCFVVVRDISDEHRRMRATLAETRLEATSTLAGGIAHEFNNLMVAVLGNATLLREMMSPGKTPDGMLGEIEGAARRVGELSQQLLAFARGGKYQPRILNLNDMILDATRAYGHVFSGEVAVALDLAQGLDNTEADPAQVMQVILALSRNAVEAVERDGRVTFSTRNRPVSPPLAESHPGLEPGDYVELAVHDSGQGMDSLTRERIFEPYFSTKSRGRGLDLAAVYGVVKHHRGYVYVDSELGRGTCVHVLLPATKEVAESAPAPPEADPGGQETVLLVDDDELVVTVTRRWMERFGYRVISASNGREAVTMARDFSGPIDVALLDLAMPVMGGVEAFPLLREARPKMKVIIVSGYELDDASQKLLRAGASAFVHKPFQPSDLAAEIRRALAG